MDFSQCLRWAIYGRGMNVKEFSKKSGIPYDTLQNYICGSNLPHYGQLMKMRLTLGYDFDKAVFEDAKEKL